MPTSNAFSRRRSRNRKRVTSNGRVSAALARAQARIDRESFKLEEMDSIDVEVTSTIHEQQIGNSLRRDEHRKISKPHHFGAKLKLSISSSQEDNDIQKINSHNAISSPRSPLVPKSQASAMSPKSFSMNPRSLDVSPKHLNVPTDDRNPVIELSRSTFSSVNQENYYSPSNHLLSATSSNAASEPSVNSSQYEDCGKAESNQKNNSISICEAFYPDLPTKRDQPHETPKEYPPASIVSPLGLSLQSAIPKEFDMNTELSAIREIMKKKKETIKVYCEGDNSSLHMKTSTTREKTVSRDFTEANEYPRIFDWQIENVASKKSGTGWESSEPAGKDGIYHDDCSFRFNSVQSEDSVEWNNLDAERLVKTFFSISSDAEESIPTPSIYQKKTCVVDTSEKNDNNRNCGNVADSVYEERNPPRNIFEKKENDEKKESFDASTMDNMLSMTKNEDTFGESENCLRMSQSENSLIITKTTKTENSNKPGIEKEGNDSTIENTVNMSSSLKVGELSNLLKPDNANKATQYITSAVTLDRYNSHGSNIEAKDEVFVENMMSGNEEQIEMSSSEYHDIKTTSVRSRTNETGEPSIEESGAEISSVEFAVYFETFKDVIADLRKADGVLSVKGHQLDRFVEMATPLFVEIQTIKRLKEEIRLMAPSVNLPKHLAEAITDITFHQEVNSASIENNFDAIMRSNTMIAVDIAYGSDEIEVDYNVGLLAIGSVHTNDIPAESELIDQMRSNEISLPTKDEIDNQNTEITGGNSTLDTGIFADTCEHYSQSKDYKKTSTQTPTDSSSPWSDGNSSRLQEFMDFAFPLITTGLTSTAEKKHLLDEAKRSSIPIEFVDHLLEMQLEMKEGQQLTENLSEEIRSIISEDLPSKFQKQDFDEIENIDVSDRVSSYLSTLNELKQDRPVDLDRAAFVENSNQEKGEVKVCNQAITKPSLYIGSKEGRGRYILEHGGSNHATEADSNAESFTEVQNQFSEVKSDNQIFTEEEGDRGLLSTHEVMPKEALACEKDKTESGLLKQADKKTVSCKTGKGCNAHSSHLENEVEDRAATEQRYEEKLNSKEEEPSLEEDITEENYIRCDPILINDGSKVEKTLSKMNRSQVGIISQESEGEKIICLWKSLDDDDKASKDMHDRYEPNVVDSWDNDDISDRCESASPKFEITNIDKVHDKYTENMINENERRCDDINATGVDAYENDNERTDASEGNQYDPIKQKDESLGKGDYLSQSSSSIIPDYVQSNKRTYVEENPPPLKIETTQQSGDAEIEITMLGSRADKNEICIPEIGDDLGKDVVHLEDGDWQNKSYSTGGEHHGYEPFLLEGSQSQLSGLEVNDVVTGGKEADKENNINGEASSSYCNFDKNHHLLQSHTF